MAANLTSATAWSKPANRARHACLTGCVWAAAAWVACAPAVAAESCPPPPQAVRDIVLPRFYADAEGSVVDPKLAAAHKAAVAPLVEFLRHVTADADKAWKRAKPADRAQSARCALGWLAAWARGDAWLGQMGSKQAEYQRKWDLAGVALSYIKLKPYAEPAERAVIEPWLLRFADRARGFFDDPERRRNNHWYWLGLALGATAIATDSARHWDLARGIMADAARDIASDGTLKAELDRKARALHYHAFAAMPLVVLAELARAKGEDWYAPGDGALHRLVKTTLDGFADPHLFERLSGEPQEPGTRPGAGWTGLYRARYPDRAPGAALDGAEGHRWLGGSVTILAEALEQIRRDSRTEISPESRKKL